MEKEEKSIFGKIVGAIGFGKKKESALGQLDIKNQDDDIESEGLVGNSKKKLVKL